MFAIRSEDALSWHACNLQLAGVAERSGFRVRACRISRRWYVWATDGDFAAICTQLEVN